MKENKYNKGQKQNISFFDVFLEMVYHIIIAYDKALPFIFVIGSITMYLNHLIETI